MTRCQQILYIFGIHFCSGENKPGGKLEHIIGLYVCVILYAGNCGDVFSVCSENYKINYQLKQLEIGSEFG